MERSTLKELLLTEQQELTARIEKIEKNVQFPELLL